MLKHKLFLGAFIVLMVLIHAFLNPWEFSEIVLKSLSVSVIMILFWILEILPLPVTALFPIVLFPLLEIEDISDTTRHYADPVIFLFMGGFFIALAIEKWNLHKRVALNILYITGSGGNQILLGFMLSTFAISMWLSNTATTMMMFPIAMSVIKVVELSNPDRPVQFFTISLLLGIAYASNIGGLATLIGTPPNVAFAAYVRENLGIEIGFFEWMKICFPLSILLLLLVYWSLCKILFPNHLNHQKSGYDYIKTEKKSLGNWTKSEIRTFAVFIITALLWIFRSVIENSSGLHFSDSSISILAGISLFIIPSGHKNETLQSFDETDSGSDDRLLNWKDTSRMSWGILLMFGGGLTLAKGLENAGLMASMGSFIADHAPQNLLILVFTITVVSIFLSEVMSNIAQVVVMAPIIGSIALAMGQNPLTLGIAMTLAASCAGMLPMGTPPNAIVFSSGKIPLKLMMRAGLVINLISILVVSLFCYLLI